MTVLETRYSTSDLCDRFEITDRTLRRWVENLAKEKGIEVASIKEGHFVYYPQESVDIFTEYKTHLIKDPRNNIHNFELLSNATVEVEADIPAPDNAAHVDLSNLQLPPNVDVKAVAVEIAIAFAKALEQYGRTSVLSPLDRKKQLLECVENNFTLTSAEVKLYTGKLPRRCRKDNDGSRYYPYGKFRFYMVGFQSGQSIWSVKFKKTQANHENTSSGI